MLWLAAGLALPAISLADVKWIEQGPAPIGNGQVEGMAAQGNPVNGAIERIAVNPTNSNIMVIGAVNGGLWRTTNATAANPTWTPVGDYLPSLSIGALTYDKANSNILYAGNGKYSALASTGGARAGLYTSTDGGLHWNTVAGNAAFTAGGCNISGVVANGNTILVTADSSDVASYSFRGVYRSTDGGKTFTHLTYSAGLANRVGTDIVADPSNPNRYYMAAHNAYSVADRGVFRSDDAGATWTEIHDAAMDAVVNSTTGNMKLAINNNGALFVGVVDSGRLAGVFRTTDQGSSFTNFGTPTTLDGPAGNTVTNGIHPGGQGGVHFSLLADPTNNNVLYIGGDRQPLGSEVNNLSAVGATNYTGRIFRSSGAGSWTAITNNQTSNGSSPHADSRVMALDLNGNLIEGDDGGLYRRTSPSTSSGAWTSLGGSGTSGGLRTAEVHSVAYDNHGGVIIAGTQDTGAITQTAHNATTWDTLSQGDGGVVAVFDKPGQNSFRYYNYVNLRNFAYRSFDSNGKQVGGIQYKSLTVNGTGGLNIQTFEPTAMFDDEGVKAAVPDAPLLEPGVPFYAKYVANKVDPGRLVFGSNALYETADHGATLTCLNGVTNGAPSFKFASPVNALQYGGFVGSTGYADVLYTGEGTELRVRIAGSGFNVLPTVDTAYNTAAGSTGFAITDIMEDYKDWHKTFVADSLERVFYTTDNGTSWSNISGNLKSLIGDELETLEYVNLGSRRWLLAGGLNGVFYSLDTGTGFGTWSELGAASLPNAKVRDLDYDPYADVLVVGLQGRGAFAINNFTSAMVPEPGSLSLLSVGFAALTMRRRRRPTPETK